MRDVKVFDVSSDNNSKNQFKKKTFSKEVVEDNSRPKKLFKKDKSNKYSSRNIYLSIDEDS